MKISARQMRLIHVLSRQLGMDSDQLHEAIAGVTGKDSIKALTKAEANEVIDHLEKAGAKITRKKKSKSRKRAPSLPPGVVRMKSRAQMEPVSHDQLQLIQALESELGWADDPRRLRGLILKVLKKRRIRTRLDGQKMIEALKNISPKQRKKEA
jgi:hypothetical protein